MPSVRRNRCGARDGPLQFGKTEFRTQSGEDHCIGSGVVRFQFGGDCFTGSQVCEPSATDVECPLQCHSPRVVRFVGDGRFDCNLQLFPHTGDAAPDRGATVRKRSRYLARIRHDSDLAPNTICMYRQVSRSAMCADGMYEVMRSPNSTGSTALTAVVSNNRQA